MCGQVIESPEPQHLAAAPIDGRNHQVRSIGRDGDPPICRHRGRNARAGGQRDRRPVDRQGLRAAVGPDECGNRRRDRDADDEGGQNRPPRPHLCHASWLAHRVMNASKSRRRQRIQRECEIVGGLKSRRRPPFRDTDRQCARAPVECASRTTGRSGGSSLRMAPSVSAAVSPAKARRPPSISYRTAPNAKMSVR